jgi:hypothetical protein
MPEAGRGWIKEALELTPTALGQDLAVCGLTPELSRADLRPWAGENYPHSHEAAKRARLERIVRFQAVSRRLEQAESASAWFLGWCEPE